jgi:hypothetical protein
VESQFNFGASVVQGADGQPHVSMTFQFGILAQAITLPEDVATQFAAHFFRQLTETCAQARRAKLGLLLPDGVQFPIPPVNGKDPT